MTAIQYISQLGSAAAWGATDLIPVTQGSTGALTGTTRKMTVAQLFTSPAFTGTTTLGNNLANYVTIAGAAAGVAPAIAVAGADTNSDLNVKGKGTGATTAPRMFVGAASDRSGMDLATVFQSHARLNYATTASGGWRVRGAYSGTVTSGQAIYNSVNIDIDTVDPTTGSGPLGAHGFYVGHTVSAGAKGGRTAVTAFLNITGAITPVAGDGRYHTALGATAQSSAPAGGTAGLGNQKGNVFGANIIAKIQNGAGLYWNGIAGTEINVAAEAGTQSYYKNGLAVIQLSTDAVAGGGAMDSGFLLCTQTGGSVPGWDMGITFGHGVGWWPIKSTGTMIGTVAGTIGGGPSYAAAYGVDFRAVTFSTAAFASPGFSVDGTGLTTTNGLLTNGMIILGSGGPRITTGSGAPPVILTLAKGSLYIRVDGGVGSTIYVSQGGGTWNAIAGV